MLNGLDAVRRVLEFRLFEVGESVVTVATLLIAGTVLVVTVIAASGLKAVAARALISRGARPGPAASISTLLRYVVLIIGVAIALDTAGINLAALFAAGALFAVGLEFAMQSIAQNFAVLIQTMVTNYTLKDLVYCIRVLVGVAYDSDMETVNTTLQAVAVEVSERFAVRDREPQVILTDFGKHAVNWEVAIWMNDPWPARPAMSALHEAIWWAFKKQGIVIASPQLDVHFDPAVDVALTRAAGAAA
jgi:small-conductance mechanosensitive channel